MCPVPGPVEGVQLSLHTPEPPHLKLFLVTRSVPAAGRGRGRDGREARASEGARGEGDRADAGGHGEGPRGRGRGRPSSASAQAAATAAAATRTLQQEPRQPGGPEEGWGTPPGIPVHGARPPCWDHTSIQTAALLSCRGQI